MAEPKHVKEVLAELMTAWVANIHTTPLPEAVEEQWREALATIPDHDEQFRAEHPDIATYGDPSAA